MPTFKEAEDLEKIAKQLISKVPLVDHVDAEEVLFLRETETKPKALARCYKNGDHPIGFFTDKKYCIVVYQANCDCLSADQMAILLAHEMMHIPDHGEKLVEHDVKDFRSILGLDLDWSEPGRKVPDLLGKKRGRNQEKPDLSADKSRGKTSRRSLRSGEPHAEHKRDVQGGKD